MRPLHELINEADSGWPLVQKWISSSSRPCEILPSGDASSSQALLSAQVTTRSPMGAIIYESAGLLIDYGWLRVLGSGSHERLKRSLPDWNQNRSNGFLFVADDAVGGFFAVNGGALGADPGKIYYLAPDTLKWQALNMTYTEFLVWSLGPKLDLFYQSLRWSGWQDEIKTLSGDRVISFYPFLWAQGPPLSERHRSTVPIEEHYALMLGTK